VRLTRERFTVAGLVPTAGPGRWQSWSGPADCRAAQATQRQLAGTNLTPPHAGTLAARVVITHKSQVPGLGAHRLVNQTSRRSMHRPRLVLSRPARSRGTRNDCLGHSIASWAGSRTRHSPIGG